MAKISGILTDGAGQIISDCVIELYAKKTTSEVLMQTHAFIVANDGRYSIDVLPCDYEVSLIINGFPKKRLGTIKVYSNSGDGTLNDYLTDPSETEINSEFIQQVLDARNEAGKSAKAAKQSETNAVNILNNVVKKTGDTITTLTITDPIALCLKGSDKEISTLFHYDGTSFEILFNKGSDPNGLKAIQINSNTGDVNFNHNVAINGKSIIKQDEYGVGHQNLSLIKISDNLNEQNASFFGSTYVNMPESIKPYINNGAGIVGINLPYRTTSEGWKASSRFFTVVGGTPSKIFYQECHNGTWQKPVQLITDEIINNYQNGIGTGQTWQNVKGDRAQGVNYTNTTDKPILVNISFIPSDGSYNENVIYVDGIAVAKIWRNSSYNNGGTLTAIIPVGSVYCVKGYWTIETWAELR